MNHKMLVAASLISIVLTSAASAQCVSCAIYPDRDLLNNEALTPAAKAAQAGSANTENAQQRARNAHAELRGHRHLRHSGAEAERAR